MADASFRVWASGAPQQFGIFPPGRLTALDFSFCGYWDVGGAAGTGTVLMAFAGEPLMIFELMAR